MSRYRGVRRIIQTETARKIDRERAETDDRLDPRKFSDSDLTGAIYRLQGRNRDGSRRDRIRELVAEQVRRRGASA